MVKRGGRQAYIQAAIDKHMKAAASYQAELEELAKVETKTLPTPSEIDLFYEFLGERIKEARLERKIQQTLMGPLIGATRTSIANLESGKQRMPVHRIVDICLVLDLDFGELMGSVFDDWSKAVEKSQKKGGKPKKKPRATIVEAVNHEQTEQ